jgi:hypothetical protein
MASQVLVNNTSQSLPVVVKKLGGNPITLLVSNPYFSKYPMLPQPRLLIAPQPFSILVLEL